MVSHHLAMFGSHWSIPIGDMSPSSSQYVTALPSLVVIGTAVAEICF